MFKRHCCIILETNQITLIIKWNKFLPDCSKLVMLPNGDSTLVVELFDCNKEFNFGWFLSFSDFFLFILRVLCCTSYSKLSDRLLIPYRRNLKVKKLHDICFKFILSNQWALLSNNPITSLVEFNSFLPHQIFYSVLNFSFFCYACHKCLVFWDSLKLRQDFQSLHEIGIVSILKFKRPVFFGSIL